MEDRSFDELSKRLASPISRRGVLKAFAASVAGAVFVGLDGGRALAEDKKCSGIGGKCNPGHDCCGGLVCNHTGPGANGTCVCPSGTTTCGKNCCVAGLVCNSAGTCVCPDATGKPGNVPCGFTPAGKPICCSACQKCSGGTCVDICPSEQACSGGTCLCTSNGEAPCNGTCCPAGQTCSNGTCVCKGTLQPPCLDGTGAQICCRSDQTCRGHAGCVCTSNQQPPCMDNSGNQICCPSNQTCDTVTQSCVCTAAQACGDICCPTGTTCTPSGDCRCNDTGNRPCGVDANGKAICCVSPQVCSNGTCRDLPCPTGSTAVCGTPSGRVCCPPGTICADNVDTGEFACVCENTLHEPCGFDVSGTAICCKPGQFCLAGACSNSCPEEVCPTDTGVCCMSPYARCVQDATGKTRCACTHNGGDYCGPVSDPSIAVCCAPGQTVCQNGKCVPA